MSLIEKLHRYSNYLSFLLPYVQIIAILLLTSAVWLIFFSSSPKADDYLLPTFAGFLWSLLFIAMVKAFAVVPPIPTKEDRFWTRIKLKIKRMLFAIMALLFITASIVVLVTTLRLMSVWIKS